MSTEPSAETAPVSDGADWSKTAKDLVVAVPLAHIIFSASYLVAYEHSFSDALSSFASPSDIFSVSIREIGWVYFTLFIFLIGSVIHHRARYGYYHHIDYIQSLAGADHEAALTRFIKDRKAFRNTVLFSSAFSLVVSAFLWYVSGITPYGPLFFAVPGPVVLYIAWAGSRIRWGTFEFTVAIVLSILFIDCVFRGLIQGQEDRYAVYSERVQTSATCGEFAVLRSIGDRLLAVRKDNRSVLIDFDCKQEFEFPEARKPVQRKLFGLPLDR